MTLSHFALDVLNCIRLNGYEVSMRPSSTSNLITIFDLERGAETSIPLNPDNQNAVLDRLATDYCTPQQYENLFASVVTLVSAGV